MGANMNLLISTPGRCGTHWLSRILCKIFNLAQQKTHRAADTLIEGANRLYLSHDPPWLFRAGGLDTIAMLRDPRDIIVSAAYYWASVLHGGRYDVLRAFWDLDLPDDATFDGALHQLKMTGFNTRWFRSYLEHQEGVCRAVVRYEDLWYQPCRTLMAAVAALGQKVDASQVEQSLDQCSFRRYSGERMRGQEDIASFYRKGIVGDWRNHFTPKENEAFCARFAWLLGPLGYDMDRLAHG